MATVTSLAKVEGAMGSHGFVPEVSSGIQTSLVGARMGRMGTSMYISF